MAKMPKYTTENVIPPVQPVGKVSNNPPLHQANSAENRNCSHVMRITSKEPAKKLTATICSPYNTLQTSVSISP